MNLSVKKRAVTQLYGLTTDNINENYYDNDQYMLLEHKTFGFSFSMNRQSKASLFSSFSLTKWCCV